MSETTSPGATMPTAIELDSDDLHEATAVWDPRSQPGGSSRGWWSGELRPLLLRVHFYAGLFVGPFLLLAAVTGLLYTTTP
jgi:hypothetical protein